MRRSPKSHVPQGLPKATTVMVFWFSAGVQSRDF